MKLYTRNLAGSTWRLLAGVCLVFCLLLAACTSTPASAPPTSEDPKAVKQEIEVGKSAFAKIAGKFGVMHDRDATAYLNLYLKSLAMYTERQGLEYAAAILDTDQVNGYSLPGGYVLITRGALARMSDPGALAGVLAHELGHINLKHILENVTIKVNFSFLETLARVLAGPRQVITAAMDQINEKIEERLFIEGHASGDEFAADAYAVKLLQSLNISVAPYRKFLAGLESADTAASRADLDKTHPPLEKRLAAIDALMKPGLPELAPTAEFTQFLTTVKTTEVKK